ncbi:hypothetical protein CON65_10095 [Bacillus pseudomycoides]|uniref:DUF4397 domain-containing protein n=1 Tax=Bacillus pseudomycoides TaxID=64104 RepID=A0AA91VCI1_9BACI|nr:MULTISPECIES: DUF4397 domain-containing protein [Bacillus]PEB51045.1 hypothetical protein COO03_18965 [Bacillus sp. AFS098217]PED82757.1 hypothetical protein CON65_10095 [Bacillus pseudomycoides]PEU15606.1 hypothetical protein CN525_16920 [Bacillus sp. AFS014408]PEU16352.1 hypothetical protein CN524_04640 [Bacillus sp. AFS019443]PFW65175.1 hypothetical protein COL20_01590 [Bacillus sp. AFS075034]
MAQSEIEKYGQEAARYEQLARYYQYTNPKKYIELSMKYHHAITQLVHAYEKRESQEATLPSHIRIFHASSHTPPIDILVNGQRVIKNISFKQLSPYFSLAQGQYRIDIVPVDNETPIFSALVPMMGNHSYTLAVLGNNSHIQLQPMLDNTHLPSGQAKIRFAHLSPDTPVVNVSLKDGDHLFENVLFKQITDYLQVSPGTADIEISLADTKKILVTIPKVKVEPNTIYTISLVGYSTQSPNVEAVILTN